MKTDGKDIWVFTPSRTSPEILEAILVQRHDLLKDAVERVRESVLTAHKHHLLFVGPRGCGKTHLVSLIVSRLLADGELGDAMRLAWLNEDETSSTLLDLLLKIHAALQKRYPDEYRPDQLLAAYDLPAQAAQDFVARQLLDALGARTLVIATENLDQLLEGLGDSGQKQLRAFIQENPRLSIVATAQRLVEELSDRIRPFFGFFQTEHLKPLNVDEATQLLRNIARQNHESGVEEFLATSRGRARVKALHHLSGGNHRIYIVLSKFITRDSIDALVGPFMQMVDELTPYYQERIRWLPPLQRRIVECLCSSEGTMPVKEIAKRLFATPQTISSQLQALREKGYVEANQRGRESLYEVSEPLMRICVEVKDNHRHQPLRLLVDFLRVWYDEPDLRARLGRLPAGSISCTYLETAILRNDLEGNLRKRILAEELVGPTWPDGALKELSNQPEAVILALERMNAGDNKAAMACLDEALALDATSPDRAAVFLFRATLRDSLVDRQGAMADWTAAISLPGAPVLMVASGLVNRAIAHGELGDRKAAMADWTAVIGLVGVPVEIAAAAFLARGYAYGELGDRQREMEDLTAVIGLSGAPPVLIATAYVLRGLAALWGSEYGKAREDLRCALHIPQCPRDVSVVSHLSLGAIDLGEGRWSDGFQVINAGLEIGARGRPPEYGRASGLVGVIFSAGLDPKNRAEKVGELLGIYERHSALSALGEGVVQHIGTVFQDGAPFPSTDNLDGWVSAWEEAAKAVPDFGFSVRLLRTGVEFIKAGGARGVLLDLTSPERAILEQALGLDDDKNGS
jgi:tetratricopeptide (TPR) repeat protein